MKIILATFGSRGDVQPLLALALSLQKAGHKVLLAGPPEKAGWAASLGCPYFPLGNDLTRFVEGMGTAYTIRSALAFVQYVRKETIAQFAVFEKLLPGADLVVGSSLVFSLSTVSEHLRLPYRFIAFSPQMIPSGFHPYPAFKHQWPPGRMNRLTWKIGWIFGRVDTTRLVNQKRKHYGLPPIRDSLSHILGPHLLVASDPEVAPVPPDVTIPYSQTGYLHLIQPEQYLPPLEAFLALGPKPVYVGFGSMPQKDQAAALPFVVQAGRSLGQRLIIANYWDDPLPIPASEDLFFLGPYPHLDLFPRMTAVIHHGGAGTTATCARSGVPQIIVPHVLDQFYWGHQVFQAGLGPKPIPRARISVSRFTEALNSCLTSPRIQQTAREASERIRRTDSHQTTIRELLKRNTC
jgi:UDP:flavonoid glycosyltransferase YjiC (YdhE family)